MKNILFHVVITLILLSVFNRQAFAQQYNNGNAVFIQMIKDKQDIQELIDAYSHDADRRLAQQQASLFTENGAIEIYHGEPAGHEPDTVLQGRNSLLKGFGILKKYDVTMHFNGQTMIHVNGDSATGEVYCLAHHLFKENGKRMLMIMGIRYYDTYVRENNKWLFAVRKLILDWVDKRQSLSQ